MHRLAAFALLSLALAVLAIPASASAVTKFMTTGNVEFETVAKTVANHEFVIEGQKATCAEQEFETGPTQTASPTESLSMTVQYNKCTAFGFINATVDASGCEFEFGAGAETAADVFVGELVLQCEVEAKITITSGTCEATIGGTQGFNTGIVAENVKAVPKRVYYTLGIGEIVVNKTKDGLGCPFKGTGAAKATYSGPVEMDAYSGGFLTALTLEA